jgi:hypothetical protein
MRNYQIFVAHPIFLPMGLGIPPPGPKAMLLSLPMGLGIPPPGPKAMLLSLPMGLGIPPPGPKVAAYELAGRAAKDRRLARTAKRETVDVFKRGSGAQKRCTKRIRSMHLGEIFSSELLIFTKECAFLTIEALWALLMAGNALLFVVSQ